MDAGEITDKGYVNQRRGAGAARPRTSRGSSRSRPMRRSSRRRQRPPVSNARLTSSGHGVASRVARSMRQTVIDAVAATPSAAPMTTA